MIERLLIPLDGSALSERALPIAAAIARAASARLMLLRAIAPAGWTDDDEDDRRALAALDLLATQLRHQQIEAETRLARSYYVEVGKTICEQALAHQARLIVMSTHGRGGLSRMLYGSTADQVLRQAKMPVLLVPAACDRAWPTERRPRILVPLDGSAWSNEALAPAGELASLLGAELLLLRVVEPPTLTPFQVDQAIEAARTALNVLAERLRDAGQRVETTTWVGFATPTITTFAREREVDLIAMATHGRGGAARAVLGSVASGVLQRAATPVLLCRPKVVHRKRERQEARPVETQSASKPRRSGTDQNAPRPG